jgi:hypothetical protein
MTHLTIKETVIRDINPSVFRAIDDSLDLGHCDHPLLQNLSELAYWQGLPGITPLAGTRMFLGLRLKKLFLSIHSSNVELEGLEEFLKAVKSRCPSLQNLRISGNIVSRKLGRVVSDLVCGLPCLQQVLLVDVDLNGKALIFLASLPSLRILCAPLTRETALCTVRNSIPDLPFPALRFFHASVASFADAGEFFPYISSSSSVKSLSINVTTIPPAQELYTFLVLVKQSGLRETLTAVFLRVASWDSPPLSHSLEAHTLSPLLQCRNLEEISINIRYRQQAINNSLMKDMALAWPRLRKFSIFPFHDVNHQCLNVNLEGLFHLAQHCRMLGSVSYQFDMSLPTNSTYLGNGIRNESLTRLSLHRSRITDPSTVATLLFEVFPNLKLDHSWRCTEGPDWDSSDEEGDPAIIEMANRWKDVDKLLEIKRRERPSGLDRSPVVRICFIIYKYDIFSTYFR